MAVTLPNFADLGLANPQPATTQPVYPQESPQAQAETTLGKGIAAAGDAASDIDLYQQLAKDKLEEANATVDLFSRVDPLRAQIAKETDPAKVAELKQQADNLLATSGQAIGNPLRRQMWTATHTRTISQLGVEADTRNTELGRGQAVADIHANADKAVRTAVGSDDPQAVAIAQQSINDLGEYGQGYGALTPQGAYTFKKQQQAQLYVGKTDRLIEQGRPDQAAQLLDAHREDIDAVSIERLQLRIAGKANKIATDGAALRALGLPTTGLTVPVGSLPSDPTASTDGMAIGGAIPQRIAAEAQSQNVDPATALATAHIESGMGRNLGSRGNIFQLGKPEWASVGGGPMGDAATDIKNGVAFLGKTQQDLTDALGRQPEPWETYLAHQQGVAGATALLSHPDTPAGRLVGDKAISANGGDPNAPASAFVSKWRGAFNHNLSLYSGGVSGEAAASSANGPIAVGDSIAVQQIRHGLAGGEDAQNAGQPLGAGTAAVGDTPDRVLSRITGADPATFAGKAVFLSTGASNDPSKVALAADQIDKLKAGGASAIVIPGVGPGVKNAAQVNAELSNIAKANGAVFFQPDVKWQKDGVHPAEVDKVRAQAQQALGQAAPDQVVGEPAAGSALAPASAPQPAQSRTGLPSLTDAYMRILRDPAIKTDEQARQAFQTATAIHNAMEADAARTERLQIAQRHQVLEQRTNEIWSDVYGGQSKITAQQIATDPAFNDNPERRKAMIELINNPPGSGIPAPQSYAAASALVDRIRLPYGDPNKITTPDEIYANIGKLNRPDLEFALKTLDNSINPDREKFSQREKDFLAGVRPQIDKSGIMPGLPNDGRGRLKFYEFQNRLDGKIDQYLKGGKDPNDLLSPDKPDYMGGDDALKPYKRSMAQALADFQSEMGGGNEATKTFGPAAAIDPAKIGSLGDLQAAVRANPGLRDQAVSLALEKGWIKPDAASTRPDLIPQGR